jgi:hypothetical protein
VQEALLPSGGGGSYPDDPDEYEDDAAEAEDDKDEDEKKMFKQDMLLNTRQAMDLMIIPFQIAAVTLVSLVVTSDNPHSTDAHWWYGYNLSFALIICSSLVIITAYTYKFASSKKREARFLDHFGKFYLGTIFMGFVNIFKSDGSPWKTDIRRVWASILLAILAVLFIFLAFNLANLIGKLVVYLLGLPKLLIKKIFCKDVPHQIKANIYEEAESIMITMKDW